jgi:hypothetical protein
VPPITIDVPSDQRDDVLRELLGLYGVKAEAIYHAVDGYLTAEEPVDGLLCHRAEMAAVDSLIEQLGWQRGGSSRAGRISGERHLLTEISHGALRSAVEELNTTLSRAAEGTAEVEAIGNGLRRSTALFELLLAAACPPAASPRQ